MAQGTVRRNSSRRILATTENRDDAPVAAIHRRRKSAMLTLLGTFEELIEPLVPAGNDEAIKNFKGVCRQKINGLAYEALRALKSTPEDHVSDLPGDLAERLGFDDTEA